MKLILIELCKKIVKVLVIAFVSFTGYKEDNYSAKNTNKNKSLTLMTEITPYTTEVKYNKDIEKGKQNVLQEGSNGYIITNEETKEKIIEKQAINKIVEEGTKETVIPVVQTKKTESQVQTIKSSSSSANTIESFTGKMTAYGGDCCGGSGSVAYVHHNLLRDGIYYHDNTFGDVRILSAAPQKFTAGTIVEVVESGSTYYGIVLDWGGSMRNAWNNGTVWMDLAFRTEAEAGSYGTKYNVTFNIKRYGW